ncbi:MAG: response regulator transcription factor [Candidatus Hydrogenedentes bacterium]|nr:response regulator transcription factor [Candidatus Hydrogenedentota bacterium]
MRILVADDDNTSRIALTAVLKRLGHDVTSAADGDEAWAVLQKPDSPKLAVLDWMMPGLTGVQVCENVRKAIGISSKYLILLTARADKGDIIEGLDSGANDYVTKPFDEGELVARIRVGERVLDLEQQLRNRVTELEEAMEHIKFLQGILPICMFCHRIRDDEESWRRIEDYLSEHTDVQLSHGLCPSCFEKHYPELYHKSRGEAASN